MQDFVITKDRQAVTSSLNVAGNFERNHQHVLRDIDGLKEGVQNWTDLFYEDTYVHPQNKQRYRVIYMNRDGFTLLAMGFTGRKALQFKLKYIEAFNQMEEHIKSEQTKQVNSDLADIKLKNATARVMNATTRQAKLYVDMAKDATSEVNKALLQDKAVEVLNGEKMLEMPTLSQHLYDSDQIAEQLGVLSKSGKPHGTAVSQLIKREIFLDENESEIVPEATNHWGGSVTKYAESVISKVQIWLENHDYPTKIKGSKMDYHVQYEM